MYIGISDLEGKKVKNLVNCQQLLFTKTEWHSKFGCNLCKIYWEKHPRPFVKVIESSEIYNFPIHHFVHFYSIFWRFLRSNRVLWNIFEPRRAPRLLTVDYRIKVHMDLQADKSPVIVKGPFFPRVVNPRYRIRGTMCNARIQSSRSYLMKNQIAYNLRDHQENKSNLI
jgi:hypothetical protein